MEIWVCGACAEKINSTAPPQICGCGVVGAFFPNSARGPGPDPDDIEPPGGNSVPLSLEQGISRGHSTGIPELDRRLSGGIPSGCPVLIYGPSYSGKSTLAIQIAAHLPGPVLLVCPEMSAPVLKTVAVRSGADISRFHRFEGELEHWRDTADLLGALVVVVDSISKFSSAPDALDMAISWARESGGVSLSIAHESRRGKPLQRAEYEPDGVFRVTRRGKVRRVDVQKARWNGFSGTIVLGEKKRARRA